MPRRNKKHTVQQLDHELQVLKKRVITLAPPKVVNEVCTFVDSI